MKKYDDVQLSRILSTHCAGQLYYTGSSHPGGGCVEQVALLADTDNFLPGNEDVREWFDNYYCSRWDAGEFLEALKSQGLV